MNAMRDVVVGWIAFGALVAFTLAMLTHLRLWSVARDVRRIADVLEEIALRNQGPQLTPNEVHEYPE